jgi:hypothetical protein
MAVESPIFEALHRNNYEMLEVWLADKPELVHQACVLSGQTPLGYALARVDKRLVTLFLKYGALPTMPSERFACYNRSLARPVAQTWQAHMRKLALLMLVIGKVYFRRYRDVFSLFARKLWEQRMKYL